jgi:hypothetical protein
MVWSMPLVSGPQAVVCAPCSASFSFEPTAVAQVLWPWKVMHTSHSVEARAVVI